MHQIKISGYIREGEYDNDKMTLNSYNIDKLKNIIDTYGELTFVPFIGKQGVKVKAGKLKSIAAIHGQSVSEYITANYTDRNVNIVANIRKNKFKNSTSISLILQSIEID